MCDNNKQNIKQNINMGDQGKDVDIMTLNNDKSFEEISLMFLESKDMASLKKYLMFKFDTFNFTQEMQAILTLAWLFETIISETSMINIDNNDIDENDDEFSKLIANKDVQDCIKLNPNIFYDITSTYSNSRCYIQLATALRDYEKMAQHFIDSRDYERALSIIKESKNIDLIYKHGSLLMKIIPDKTVDVLIQTPNLNPSKIIPILVLENVEKNCANTIKYLEYYVDNNESPSIIVNNYLFELYARFRDETTLINYVNYIFNSDGLNSQQLDLQFCLRLCSSLNLMKTCVILYSLMDLYEEAVSLALELDIELAKSIARQPESMEQRNKLWLDIAGRVLTENRSIEIASSLLSECGLLKIEDILPFFPEYTTIDQFKEAIQKSVNEYRKQISDIRNTSFDEMAKDIRNGIKAFKNRYSVIRSNQQCEICAKSLSKSTFSVFPCGHLFHEHCLRQEYESLEFGDMPFDGVECVCCGKMLIDIIDKLPVLHTLSSDEKL